MDNNAIHSLFMFQEQKTIVSWLFNICRVGIQHGQDHTLSSSGSQFRIIVSRDMGKYKVTENEKNEQYFEALSILYLRIGKKSWITDFYICFLCIMKNVCLTFKTDISDVYSIKQKCEIIRLRLAQRKHMNVFSMWNFNFVF